MNIVSKTLRLLSPRELRRARLLLVMIMLMALLDVVGVASIMPFMAVLASPEVIQTNPYLALAYDHLGFEGTAPFLFILGLLVFIALVIAISFKALTTWALLHFTQMRNHTIAQRLVSGYLRQPYDWFLNRHSADLGKAVLIEVQQVINGALIPLMQITAHGAVVIAILCLLVAVDPFLTLYVAIGLGTGYGVIHISLRRRLTLRGQERLESNLGRFQVLAEAFGGIKEVKVGGLEEAFLNRFETPSQRFARSQITASLAAQIPRFALEIVAFGGMLLVVLYLMRGEEGLKGVLPILSLYALAGYRLMPAIQMIYTQMSQLQFSGPAVDSLYRDFINLPPPLVPIPVGPSLTLRQGISLAGITYTYPHAQSPAVTNLDLEIPACTMVGLVGATGSGKTTLVDIILGLLHPQVGQLCVDSIPITLATHRAWQRSLGYVPQQIFLSDDSVAANIAFGIAPELIDQQAVETAARIANLHDFIIRDMPQGYATMIGERGIRLSGGQRQRIGIARALYHRPQVLILDEATSALDNLTEQAVMEAVHNLGRQVTIILIAHRLTTVRDCDRIYLLHKGRVVGQGTYAEMAAGNEQFRGMARAAAMA